MTLLLTNAGALLVVMNITAPMVTLPQTAADLGAGMVGQTWTLTSGSLGLAALLLVSGTLADDLGRKRVFIGGLTVLGAANVVSAIAPDVAALVVTRGIAGAAGAAVIAASLGIVGHAFPSGPTRGRATGAWGAMAGAGTGLGPLAAAGLGDWRATYWLFAGYAAALAVMAGACLTESWGRQPRRLDLPGAVAFVAGVALLITTLAEGRGGWLRSGVLLLALAALVLLTAFVAIEARSRHPMLELSLFRQRPFIASIGGSLVVGVSAIGLVSYVPTVLQRGLGRTALVTVGVFAVMSVTSVVAALRAGGLAGRLTASRQLAIGLALCGVGDLALFGFVAAGSVPRMIPGLAIAGIGTGIANAALARLAVDSVSPDRAGMGSGANNTARYVGASVGGALVVVVVTAPGDGPAALADGTNTATVVCGVLALLGALGAAALQRPTAPKQTCRSTNDRQPRAAQERKS